MMIKFESWQNPYSKSHSYQHAVKSLLQSIRWNNDEFGPANHIFRHSLLWYHLTSESFTLFYFFITLTLLTY